MKAYLFDLDGTLLDSMELIIESFHHTTRVHLAMNSTRPTSPISSGTPAMDRAVPAQNMEASSLTGAATAAWR